MTGVKPLPASSPVDSEHDEEEEDSTRGNLICEENEEREVWFYTPRVQGGRTSIPVYKRKRLTEQTEKLGTSNGRIPFQMFTAIGRTDELESAEGSFELLVREVLQPDHFLFELQSMSLVREKKDEKSTGCEVKMTVRTRDGLHERTENAAGPFDAMAGCLRKCLAQSYPQVAEIRLKDYKVRVLEPNRGTAAKVRVLVEWSDHKSSWTTVGVSDDVLEASWNALVDSIRLELLRLTTDDKDLKETLEGHRSRVETP